MRKLCWIFLVSPFKRTFKKCNSCKSKGGQWSYQLWRSVLIAAENQSLFTLDTWTVVGWSIIPTSYHFLISSVKRRQLQLLDDKVVRASLCYTDNSAQIQQSFDIHCVLHTVFNIELGMDSYAINCVSLLIIFIVQCIGFQLRR